MRILSIHISSSNLLISKIKVIPPMYLYCIVSNKVFTFHIPTILYFIFSLISEYNFP